MSPRATTVRPADLISLLPEVGFRQEYSPEGGHLYYLNGEGPLPGATSITALQEAIGGNDGLMNWAVKLTVNTALDFYADTDDKAGAYSAAWRAKTAARDLGSGVHKVVEAMNLGNEFALTDQTAPYAAQYGAFAIKHHVEIIAAEQMVANLTHRFAGSFDALANVDGVLTLIDVKTGKPRPSYRLQLTGYAMAEWRGDKGAEPEPMPKVKQLLALYLSPDGYEPHFMDVRQSDVEHFISLVESYHRAHAWKDAA